MRRSLLVCLLLFPVLPCAAGEPRPFRFYKGVERDTPQEEAILAATFDNEVYADTRDGFPDLRVVDDRDDHVPYLVEKVTESRKHTVRETCSSRVVSLVEEEDNAIEIVVRLGDRAPAADGVTFLTPLADYERRVRVFGSSDGSDWTPLMTDGLIFDYSRYMDVDNREIRLPKNSYRQFKVVIDDVTDELESPWKELTRKFRGGQEDERIERTTVQRRPFRIDRIELWADVAREHFKSDKKADYPIAKFQVEQDAKEKRTIIDVRSGRQPLTGLSLETSSRNFSRRVVVQKPVPRGVSTDWVELGQATVSMVHFGNFHRERLKITFPEQRQEDYRIIIYNQDNPPLEITGVKAEGNVYRMVFLAVPGKTYRVYYGSESADKPSYDMATVLAPLRKGHQAVAGSLGVQLANPDFGEKPGFALRGLLGNRLILGAAICLMVVVLGWGLFRAARRVDAMPKE